MKIYGYEGKMNIIGERVKVAREKKGYSQEKLAIELQQLKVNIAQKAISRIELGDRLVPDYELLAIAEVLDVTVMWLLTGK